MMHAGDATLGIGQALMLRRVRGPLPPTPIPSHMSVRHHYTYPPTATVPRRLALAELLGATRLG